MLETIDTFEMNVGQGTITIRRLPCTSHKVLPFDLSSLRT